MKKAIVTSLLISVVAGAAFLAYITTLPGYHDYGRVIDTQPQKAQEKVEPSKYDVGPPDPQELLELVNEERKRIGVAPLMVDARLTASAQEKADDMRNRDYRAHKSPDGVHGYQIVHRNARGVCANAGENLVWGLNKNNAGTSRDSFNSWMGSESHRKALQDSRYTMTGMAVNGDIAVQHFCAPQW